MTGNEIACEVCGTTVGSRRRGKRFCSPRCRLRAFRAPRRPRPVERPAALASSTPARLIRCVCCGKLNQPKNFESAWAPVAKIVRSQSQAGHRGGWQYEPDAQLTPDELALMLEAATRGETQLARTLGKPEALSRPELVEKVEHLRDRNRQLRKLAAEALREVVRLRRAG